MNCPLCDTQNLIIIGKPLFDKKAVRFIRQDYKVVKCEICQFYFVRPKIDLSIDEWSILYGKEYFIEYNRWYKTQRLNDVQSRLKKIFLQSNSNGINFLDLGCGEGLALIEAFNKNWNVFGNDISDNRIQEAKQDKITFNQGDLFSACYPDNFFDFVYMDSVLEHLINPVDYLNELNRIMKKKAIIYIGVPNEESLFDNFRQLVFKFIGRSKLSTKLRPFETPFHISGFTKKSLRIIANLTNFKTVEVNNFATRFEFRKHSYYSRGFWIHLLSLPIDLAAIAIKMEKYYEVYLRKD
jgi:ubiquinone/menaquinone biosynthesis C-methylase UbiE